MQQDQRLFGQPLRVQRGRRRTSRRQRVEQRRAAARGLRCRPWRSPRMRSGVSLSRCAIIASSGRRPPAPRPATARPVRNWPRAPCVRRSALAANACADASRARRRHGVRSAARSASKAACSAGAGSALSCGRAGSSAGSRSRPPRSPASCVGRWSTAPAAARHRAASAPCARHRSAAISSRSSRSLPISSGASKACPVSSACSRSTRAQKPWMVRIAARSISCSAAAQARAALAASSRQLALDDAQRQRDFALVRRLGRRRRPAARRLRIGGQRQPLAQALAQFLGGRLGEGHRQDLRRRAGRARPPGARTSVARVKVLPVPALASISCTPSSGRSR